MLHIVRFAGPWPGFCARDANFCHFLKKLPKFTISNFHTSVRARGVANFTGAAASGGGVHPWSVSLSMIQTGAWKLK